MTVQAELWQLLTAAGIPTGLLVFAAGRQAGRINGHGQEIEALKANAERLERVYESLARIETDMVWVKRALEECKK